MFVNLLGNWTTVNCILIYLFPCVVVTVQGLSSITGVVNKKFCNLCNLPDLVTCLCWYLCLTLAFFTSWKKSTDVFEPSSQLRILFPHCTKWNQAGGAVLILYSLGSLTFTHSNEGTQIYPITTRWKENGKEDFRRRMRSKKKKIMRANNAS